LQIVGHKTYTVVINGVKKLNIFNKIILNNIKYGLSIYKKK